MTETDAGRQAGKLPGWTKAARLAIASLALMVAGCQTMIPKGQPPAPPPVEQPKEPGVVTPGLPTDETRHRVALLVPMTGANAAVGQSIANATTLAMLDTKTEKLRITTYDTNLGAAAAVTRALADGNKLILGPLLAEDARVIGPIARRANVPVISFSNDVSVAGNGTFLMGYNPTQAIERVVDYAKSKGVSNFAGLVPSGAYGQRSGTAFLRAVEAAGGTVTSLAVYGRDQASVTAAIRKVDAASPYQAILIADSGRFAMTAAPLIRKSTDGASARILGTELWNTESALAGSPAVRGAWFASVPDTYYRTLADKYRARYGKAPFRLSALGYDSVLLTVRVAQDWKVGSPFPTARLFDTGGFAGIDGAFRFGRDGVAERALEISQVNAGSFQTIDAAPRGFGK